MSEAHEDEYDDALVAMLDLIWGEGFMSPGGPQAVRNIVDGVDLKNKLVLDIGCGLGGIDIMLARDYGCDIIALDIEAPLLERTRAKAEAAGMRERIDFRLVEPGPLTLDDASVDVVFGKDAWTQIPNKRRCLATSTASSGQAGGCWPATGAGDPSRSAPTWRISSSLKA